eukprot:4394290-Pyramimonas_sp.AAC.1
MMYTPSTVSNAMNRCLFRHGVWCLSARFSVTGARAGGGGGARAGARAGGGGAAATGAHVCIPHRTRGQAPRTRWVRFDRWLNASLPNHVPQVARAMPIATLDPLVTPS